MNLITLVRIGIFLLFSGLMIFDYFPNIVFNDMSKTTMTIGIIAVVIIYLVINRKTDEDNEKNSFIGEAAFILYTLVLIGVLTLMGGKSTVGISLNNPILWFVLLLTIVDMTLRYRKINA
ncbi:hypothetical protein AKG34_01245 [Peribacillus butanolivorans]|uniref:hypothetical protein n=1 Tax=Peribacillus butanolivorans TaxID=421767 RepID=UPI0006A6FA98|nr:hypothetical protein [Peribacillus butanolivorans]KON67612.1 hypothetical protein AKG34_01245 [Peribacillus butanolivorans]